MFENFVVFTEVVKLSSILFGKMRLMNYSDDVLFLVCDNNDINSAEQVLPLKRDDSIIYDFIELICDNSTTNKERWIRLIFENIEDYESLKDEYKTILMTYACGCGFLDIVKKMVEVGADVNYDGSHEPLTEAIYGNRTEVVKYLIDNGAEVFSTSFLVYTAVKNNNFFILKCLIENDPRDLCFSVDVNSQNKEVIDYLKSKNELTSKKSIRFQSKDYV